ncbi:MAG TPA: LAGLIDADG family homing endonuclease, partial [Thermoplasmata archaeon]|nr:LAGLIDADG family homing endonuclease [Thermoplasmata archaeon]
FFEEAGYLSRIIQVADRYPEERSLEVSFAELNRFDTDMAIFLMRHPLNVLTAGEEAMRRLVPPGEELVQVHLRVKALPRDSRIQIRDLRAKHLGQFISVEGLVRKSTEVRPRVVGALFQCLRCGTILKEEQDGQNFREPLECYEEQGGCKRSASATKFKLLTETSVYLDTQKLEVQEAPEGLRGGEEPQRLTTYVEDDLTGLITPGNRVVMNGVLRSVQKGRPGAKSTLFDIFIDVNSIEREQVEFEEIEVTEEDARLIREAGSTPDIYRLITASIAPSLYGMYVEKEALALQLFSGVPKVLPDGRRIRGDIHLLLVGDPGTGKSELLSYMSRLSPRGIYATGKAATAAGLCVSAESLVVTDRGVRPIADVSQPYFGRSERVRSMETAAAKGAVVTVDERHRSAMRPLETVWRLKPPAAMLEISTASGLSLSVTPATKVLVDHAMGQSWIRAMFIRPGMHLATASRLDFPEQPAPLVLEFLRDVMTRVVVDISPALVEEVIEGLKRRYGTLREAAARLLLAETALYDSWRNEKQAIPLSPFLVAARAAGVPDLRVAESIRSFSQAGGHVISLPVSLNPELAYFTGLIAGDGSVERGALGGFSIRFSNSDEGLIQVYRELTRSLFQVPLNFTPQSSERAATSRFHSALVAAVLAHLGVPTSPKSHIMELPAVLLNGPRTNLALYLRGLYDTDGTILVRESGGTCLSLSTTSPELAKGVQMALLRFGIHARRRVRRVAGRKSVRIDGKTIISRREQHVLDVWDSDSLVRFREEIGFGHSRKRETLAKVTARGPHSNVNLIHGAGPHLREVRRVLGLSPKEAYGDHEGGARAVERGAEATTREFLLSRLENLSSVYASGGFSGPRVRIASDLRQAIPQAIARAGHTGVSFARSLGVPPGRVHDAFYRKSRRAPAIPVRVLERVAQQLAASDETAAARIEAAIRPYTARIAKVPSRLESLRILASADVRWEPVRTVRVLPSATEPTVYDLTVKDAHAFVANGILVHNTAAAVRDEFGEGRWTLEAGALVLADLGLACLHPDSEVLIDGSPVRIDHLFDASRAIDATAGGHPVELSPLARPTLSFDPTEARIMSSEAAFVVRRRYRGPIYRITLSSGFEVRLTPDHLVLDGESYTWKPLQALKPRARFVACQRIPGSQTPLALLDLVPEDWIVQPTDTEKRELRNLLLRRFATLAAANRAYGLARDALNGRSALRTETFRRLLRDLGLYDTWKTRPFAYGRRKSTERLRIATLTPELGYLLGFLCGDGHVKIDDRHSSVSIFQSAAHLPQIQRVLQMTKAVTPKGWGMHSRIMRSQIRGRSTESRTYHMQRGSNLLAFLYRWLTDNDLANLLRLDDNALRGFLAGLLDADGCVSIKSSTSGGNTYESVELQFMFSPRRQANLRLLYALRRFDVFSRVRQGHNVLIVQVSSRADARRLLEAMAPFSVKIKQIPKAEALQPADHEEAPSGPVAEILARVRPGLWRHLDKRYWSQLYDLSHNRRRPFKPTLAKLTEAVKPWLGPESHIRLRSLTGCDYALDRIREVRVEDYDGFVYDLRVPGPSNFVCDGVVVHNCIDEIEKMNPQDRSAIHEAMEQQRISVAKAGITAVLQSRCAVLAAANPKFGRFDEHKYISEQIDLPPALLSRFDIIFSMIDRPQAEKDRELAEHVLKGHQVGEMLRRRESGLATPETHVLEEPYTPHFNPDFLRKYVAYAKRIYPIMTDEAMGAIEKKYLDIRKTGEAAGSSVPITPRQLEAIIRLSEASARLRLSSEVTIDDADRAVRIVEYWMGKVAGEEGKFDIDIIQTGISQSQREQIISLRDIINELAGPEGVADYEDIVRIAQERGIPPAKVDSWLKRWSQEGDIYSPAKNKYKLVERL